jgi:beta-glucuronidase
LDDVKGGSFAKEQSSFHYSDILCPNVYATPTEAAHWLDVLHEQWRDKPILITEYGKRADQVKNEDERVTHFDSMLKVVRERDYVCGLSYWAMADYRSRYPGTNSNGYRPWGIVDANRSPRALYQAMRSSLMPVVVKSVESRGDDPNRKLVVAMGGRSDFPSMRVRNVRVRVISNRDNATIAEKPIDLIEPGAALTIELLLPPGAEPEPDLHVEVVSAADVVVGERTR